MPDRYTQVVVLCEDLRQFQFVRHYLIGRGVQSRRIRSQVSPAGRGSGEQYVREHYAQEVAENRRRRTQLNIGLVTLVDADTRTVKERLSELSEQLQAARQNPREREEPIAVLVPRRNVDTWIYYLRGNPVNESDDYKRHVEPRDVQPAAKRLVEQCPHSLPDAAPPALKAGCDELTALLKAQHRT